MTRPRLPGPATARNGAHLGVAFEQTTRAGAAAGAERCPVEGESRPFGVRSHRDRPKMQVLCGRREDAYVASVVKYDAGIYKARAIVCVRTARKGAAEISFAPAASRDAPRRRFSLTRARRRVSTRQHADRCSFRLKRSKRATPSPPTAKQQNQKVYTLQEIKGGGDERPCCLLREVDMCTIQCTPRKQRCSVEGRRDRPLVGAGVACALEPPALQREQRACTTRSHGTAS